MDTTKVVMPERDGARANDFAHGHIGENRCDSRVFGSSWRGDYIFSVR
jgi:hypothetical protein